VKARFALLHHTGLPGRADHYDLLLQTEETSDDDAPVLSAFATLRDALPMAAGAETLLPLPDHRAKYLWYEGKVGGARGSVTRVDDGSLEWLPPSASEESAPAGQAGPAASGTGSWHFRLEGRLLRGVFRLSRQPDGRVLLEAGRRDEP